MSDGILVFHGSGGGNIQEEILVPVKMQAWMQAKVFGD